jgi:hypothetical protein
MMRSVCSGVPPSSGSTLFDYRAAWDLAQFGATLDRTFEVLESSPGQPEATTARLESKRT